MTDDHGGAAEAWVSVTVTGRNDAPRPSVDAVLIDEDSRGLSLSVSNLLANDADPDAGDHLTIVNVSGPGVTFAGLSFSYDPGTRFQYLNAGETATERLGYTVVDAAGATADGEIIVTIEGRNDPPVARPDNIGTVEERQALSFDVLANDSDPDRGDILHIVAVDGQAILPGGTVVLASGARVMLQLDGRIAYDPTGAFVHLAFQERATETFHYTVADRSGATADATVGMVISGINDAPIATDDVASAIDQNAKATAALLANDRDPDAGDWLEVVAVDGKSIAVGTPLVLASGATVLLKPGGSLEYDPNGPFNYLSPGETAIEAVTYTVRDQLGAESTAVVRFAIVGQSDRPVAVPDSYGIDEDHLLVFDTASGVLANDYDPDAADGRRLFVSRVEGSAANVGNLVVLASGAKLVLNADGSFTYDPRQAFDRLGPFARPKDTFTYTISDAAGHESTTTVAITVVGRNDPPIAHADAGITDAHAQVRLRVVDNDTDPEQASLRVIAIDDVHKDFVRVNADGTLTYDPAGRFDSLLSGQTATDTFYYTIDDGLGGRASAQVTVTIHGTGAPASSPQTILESFEVPAAGGLVAGWGRQPAAATAVGLFSGALSGFEAYGPTHVGQAVKMVAQGSSGHGNSPIEQYLGLAADALPADDGVHSHQKGDASDASAASAMKTTVRLSAADLNAEGKLLVCFDWNVISAEQIAANKPGANDFAIFTVSSGAGGQSAVLVLSDSRETGLGASGWRTSTYDLTALFRADILAGRELTLGFAVLNDGDDLRLSSLLVDNVRFNAAPAAADLIRSDADGALQTWRLRPEAIDDQLPGPSTDAATSLVLDPAALLANDRASPGTDRLSLIGVDGAASRGQVSFDGARISYDPNRAFAGLAQGEAGTDHFRYRVRDANGGEAEGEVTLTVLGLNDAPQAHLDRLAVSEDASVVTFDVLANDDDVDSDDDASTLRIIDARSAAGAIVNFDAFPGGKIFYDVSSFPLYQALAAGETASDTITYTIADRWYGMPGLSPETTTGTGQVIVTIEGVNDLPIAVNDRAATDEDTPIDIAVLANDSDPDRTDRLQVARVNGQALSFGNPVVLASGALVGLSLDGRLRYDPANGFAHLPAGEKAVDSFTYTVSDGHGGFADATVSLIVAGLNDAPVAGRDAITVDEDHGISFSATALLANDSDPDTGDSLRVVSVTGPGVAFDGSAVSYDPGLRFQHLGVGESATERVLYAVADQAGAVTQAEVTMTIEGRNDAPLAVSDFGEVRENQVLQLSPLVNDLDTDTADLGHLHLAGIDSGRTVGIVTANPDGTISYDPAGRFDYLNWGQVAYDQFDYFVSDEHGATSRGTATVAVHGRNNFEQIVESFEPPMSWVPPPTGNAERSTTLVQTLGSYQELDGQHGVYVPTDGSQMVMLEARGTLSSNLETFLGLAPGSLARDFTDTDGTRPFAGSAIKVYMNVQAGDEVSFDWMFDARDRVLNPSDGNQDNDFALLTVTDAGGMHSYKLSDVRQVGDNGASGWHSSVYTAQTAGVLTIGLASVNDRSGEVGNLPSTENSVLLVDNFRLNRDFDESYQLVRLESDGRLETFDHTSIV